MHVCKLADMPVRTYVMQINMIIFTTGRNRRLMPFDREVKVECGCLYVEDACGMWNNIRLYGS